MGRGAGTGRSHADTFDIHGVTPGGIRYWARSSNPNIGFVDDPTKEGQQPGTIGYPIYLIDYYWGPPVEPTLKFTQKTKVTQQTRELTATALEGPICVPYGSVRVGGNVIAWRANLAFLWESLAICHGPIQGYTGVQLMGQTASLTGGFPFTNNALFQTELGLANPTGPVPSYYDEATSHQGVERVPSLATVHCKYLVGGQYPNIHEKALFSLDGRLLRDPALGTDADGVPNQPEVFSRNLMLAIADYCTSPIYGPGMGDDAIWWDSVGDVAAYCAVTVAGQPRHTINWAIMRAGASHRNVIESMMSMGRIRHFRRDGKIVFAAKKITSRAAVFGPHNSMPVESEVVPLTNVPNVFKGTFTNPSKDYSDDSPAPAMTPAALARTEPRIPTSASWEGMTNASEALRESVFGLGEMRCDLRFILDATKADATAIEPMDRIGYYSPTAALGVSLADPQDGWVERTQERPNGIVRFYCSKYDETYLSDATQATDSAPINTTVPPTDAPDAPVSPALASSLTIGDGLTAYYPSRVLVDWTHPGWPYALKYRVTRETVDEPETIVAEVGSGPVFIDLRTSLTTIRVYAFVIATGAISTALAGTVAAATPTEIVNGDTSLGVAATATISWDAPKERSSAIYGTGFWSSVSLVSYDGTKVNDGLTTATAFTTPSGTSRLKHDAGAGGKRFREVSIYGLEPAGVDGGFFVCQYSTDDVSYTSVSDQPSTSVTDMGGGVYRTTVAWADPGANKRYWRINFGAINTIREVHFSEYGVEFVEVLEYRVYDTRGAGRELAFPPITPSAIPTSATPLNVDSITTRVAQTWDTPGSAAFDLVVVVVGVDGAVSDGAAFQVSTAIAASGGTAPYVPQDSTALTLANGLNSDIAISAGPGLQAITGPSAAFSVGGSVPAGVGAEWVPLHYSGTQTLTIVNEDVSSTAENRITTASGANLVLVGPCRLLLWRDVAASRWVIAAYRDSTLSMVAAGMQSLSKSQDGTTQIGITNSDASGTSAQARLQALADVASGFFSSYGSARTLSRWGGALGGWVELRAAAGSGLVIGTEASAPLKFGTNSTVVLEIDTAQKVKIGGGAGIAAHFSGSATWNPGNVVAASFRTFDLTVTGAAVGDTVAVGMSTVLSDGMTITGQVISANLVRVTIFNMDVVDHDPASGTVRADCWRH